MSEPILCVCGHPNIDHCTISGCPSCLGKGTGERLGKACGCPLFRPCLPWPDSEGWWWCDNGNQNRISIGKAAQLGGRVLFACHSQNEFEEYHGPARFAKLIEESPFKAK